MLTLVLSGDLSALQLGFEIVAYIRTTDTVGVTRLQRGGVSKSPRTI